MNEILNIVLNIVFMLGIVGVGAFIFSIIIDAIMCLSDKHKGVYFNQQHDEFDTSSKERFINEKDVVVYRIDAPSQKEVGFIDMDAKDVKNLQTNKATASSVVLEDEDDKFIEIDYDKAVEEQRKMQDSKLRKMEQPMLTPVNAPIKNTSSHTPLNMPVKPNESEEFDFDAILDEVAKEAVIKLKAQNKPTFTPLNASLTNEIKKPNFVPVTQFETQPQTSAMQPAFQPLQPVFQPLTPNAELHPLSDEIKSLKDEIKTLRSEITNDKISSAKEVKEVYDRMLSKEIEDYKKQLQQREREIDTLKNTKSVTDIVNSAMGNFNKNETSIKNKEHELKIKELDEAREKYNIEISELEKIKKAWYEKEREFTTMKHLQEKKQLNTELDEAKKKVELKDKEIQELKSKNFNPQDKLELDRMKQEWMAKEQELLYAQKQQKNESARIIKDLNESLYQARLEITDKISEIEELKHHKEDSSKQKIELDNLRREWANKQEELNTVLKNSQIDNEQFVEKLMKDVELYKVDIAAKQKEIENLKCIEEDYTKEKIELEKIKEQWQQKEEEILRVQQEQREQDNQTIIKLKNDLKASLNEISEKEQEITALKKQKEDFTREIKELEQLKNNLVKKGKELTEVQERIKEEDQKAIKYSARELEKSKEIISELKEKAEKKEKEIVVKENEINSMRKINQDLTVYKKELQQLKEEWKEKQVEIKQAENKRELDKEQLIEKITDELNQSKGVIKEKESQINDLKNLQTDHTIQQAELKELIKNLNKREKELAELRKNQDATIKIKTEEKVFETLRRFRRTPSPLLQLKKYESPIKTATPYISTAEKETLLSTADQKKQTALSNLKGRTIPLFEKTELINRKKTQLEIAKEELNKIKEEYLPLLNAKKAFEKDVKEFNRLTTEVARKKISLYGVKRNKVVSKEEKDKLDDSIKRVEILKETNKSNMKILQQNLPKLSELEKKYVEQENFVKSLQQEIIDLKKS